MKVVIDTNVLVSAVLKDKTPEKVVLFAVTDPDIEWMVSEKILNEYREVLSRPKFKLPAGIIEEWVSLILRTTIKIKPSVKINLPRDQKDAPFLECCVSSDADFFITGDLDFTGAQKIMSTKIVSLSQFDRLVCRK
ncbi:MAG TPA: putative toxin-antitoxin system toxin component, PIN family [Spirochaetota bacterium]|nr:putative toxin-antitoxin system toxin component, PIN family [Spirochaetota bacterium]HQP49061.1 putative toxin-antitoxin system toxin component, PIN family [Spirochaetota bacterium]